MTRMLSVTERQEFYRLMALNRKDLIILRIPKKNLNQLIKFLLFFYLISNRLFILFIKLVQINVFNN